MFASLNLGIALIIAGLVFVLLVWAVLSLLPRKRVSDQAPAASSPIQADDGKSGDAVVVIQPGGRVDYVKMVNTDTDKNGTPDTLVDQIITRLGHSVAPNSVIPPVTGATMNTLSDANTTFAMSLTVLVIVIFYGLKAKGAQLVPGISSLQVAFARLNLPLETNHLGALRLI